MNNADKPINPQNYNQCGDDEFEPLVDGKRTNYEKKMPGLTKREYFAGLAMQGFLANNQSTESFNFQGEPKCIIEYAIQCADELLKQLETK